MRVYGKAFLGFVALGLTLSAIPAGATARCVSPAGGACFTTIQAAVNASAQGDSISISPGTYAESVSVGNGQDGLTIKGVGVVIVDPEIGTGSTSDGFDISANFVTLSNLTVRNGRSYGIYVYGAGFTMSAVKVLGAESYCVFLDYADFATIKGSRLEGCGSHGVYSQFADFVTITTSTFGKVDYGVYNYRGNSFTFTGNTVFNTLGFGFLHYGYNNNFGSTVTSNTMDTTQNSGVFVDGVNGATVSKNKLTTAGDTCLYIYGDDPIVTYNIATSCYTADGFDIYGAAAQIKFNTISGTNGTGIYLSSGFTDADSGVISNNNVTGFPDSDGIDAYGNNMTINANVVTNAYDGIYVNGHSPRVTSNTVSNLEGTGIYVDCPSGCTGGVVQLNKVTNVSDAGFDIYAPSANYPLRLLSNTVSKVNYDCFYISGSLVNAVGNKGYDCGDYTNYGGGFELYGTGHTLTNNFIQRTAADGYFIASAGATLTGNTADSTTEDGFDVHANNVTLTSNKATNNTASGFEVNDLDYVSAATLTGTTLTTNSASGNAVGACLSANATSTTQSGNTFGTTATPAICDEASGYIGN